MKWNYLTYNDEGKTRIITKFLFFPKSCNGETRWLCKTKILQKVRCYISGANLIYEWNIINFVD
jgi:hypothetical protein